MRILCLGDVTSPGGVEHLCQNLWRVRKDRRVDFCIVNAENAAVITGVNPQSAEKLFKAGADCITGGNHTLRQRTVYTYLDDIIPSMVQEQEIPAFARSFLAGGLYKMLVDWMKNGCLDKPEEMSVFLAAGSRALTELQVNPQNAESYEI